MRPISSPPWSIQLATTVPRPGPLKGSGLLFGVKLTTIFRIVMLIGEVFLEAMSTGIVTQAEIDWLTINQINFSREEEAKALQIGRLLDGGQLQIGCRMLGKTMA